MLRYTQIHAQLQQMLYVTLIHVLNTFPLFTVHTLFNLAKGMSNPAVISVADVSSKEYSSTEAEFSLLSF